MVQMKKFTLGDDWIPKKLGMFSKIVFPKLDGNTELARTIDVMMARANICVLMIKGNKLRFCWIAVFQTKMESSCRVIETRGSFGEL